MSHNKKKIKIFVESKNIFLKQAVMIFGVNYTLHLIVSCLILRSLYFKKLYGILIVIKVKHIYIYLFTLTILILPMKNKKIKK